MDPITDNFEYLNGTSEYSIARQQLPRIDGGIERCKPRSDIGYCTAIGIVKAAATMCITIRRKMSTHNDTTEEVALCNSVGRLSTQEHCAPFATPSADTSAMDGFAISSSATQSACQENPTHFSIQGSMFAGAESAIELPCVPEADVWPCVEIATGARFPVVKQLPGLEQRGISFDAVVPYESVTMVDCDESGKRRVLVEQPVRPYQHRRYAGDDIRKGSVILPSNSLIQPQHIMALASLGLFKVAVQKKLRVGIWSTGNEVVGMDETGKSDIPRIQEVHRVFDANGPFIMSLLDSMDIEAEYLGSAKDRADDFEERLRSALDGGRYDLLLSSGAVSAGKRDFVRAALQRLSAKILFHGARIRPGHPLLFAELGLTGQQPECTHADENLAPGEHQTDRTRDHHRVGFFGLPGNPIAAAVGLRFFVIPYLRTLQGLVDEQPKLVTVRVPPGHSDQRSKPKDKDVFWLGELRKLEDGLVFVLSSDQSPSKVRSFHCSSGWIHIPSGCSEVRNGDRFQHYPIIPHQMA